MNVKLKLAFPWVYRLLAYLRLQFGGDSIVSGPLGGRFFCSRYSFSERLIAEGAFEAHRVKRLALDVKDAVALIDIGANIGYYTVLAASRRCRVEAFEPEPLNLIRLKRNLKLNGLDQSMVRVHEFALGDKDGLIDLGRPLSDNYGHASIVNTDDCDKISVPVRRFDGLGLIVAGRYVFKIDVEGAEEIVLSGFSGIWSVLGRGSIFYIEIHRQYGANLDSIHKVFINKGFAVSYLDDDTGKESDVPAPTGDVLLIAVLV